MTEGLTFNKDLEVTIDGTKLTSEQYTLDQDDRGFTLRLNDKGLELINGKEAAATVVLTYSATVNSSAIVDIPEANDIKFHYGNNPSKGTTPLPTKPNDNGEVTVKKTWGGEDSDWVEGEYAKFKLVDANTGDDVKAEDLVDAPSDYTFEGTVTLSKGTEASHTWKYLNKDKQYKVVEVESKTLSDAEYKVNEQGKVEITNHKSNNPKPLNPTEPKVVVGGKKFVKTNQDGKERLAGAEFYVKNAAGEYLVAAKKDEKEVTDAKAALDEAVKAYNDLSAEDQKGEKGTTAKTTINEKQDAYNKAFKENASAYSWTTLKDYNDKLKEADPAAKEIKDVKDIKNIVVLTSNADGKFEITGLEYGSYKLEEKTAPKGYAKLNGEIDFKVAKGTYNGEATEFKYEVEVKEGETQTYGKQVPNKKVSIPQTGGIGSLIFIVAGLAIMGLAFVMKRRNAVEA